MTRRDCPRAGFTLLELLVVLALIGLLATLTIGAVFRVLNEQKEKNTNTHLRKIHMALEQQWKPKVDQIKNENPPQLIIEATRNADGTVDIQRAKAFHLKMRLRQEFPQNFGEVFSGGTIPAAMGQPAYIYASKPTYRTNIGNPAMIGPAFVEPILEMQSAAMLMMILSQGAGGATTNGEAIAPTKLMSFPQQNGSSIQLRVFVDEWGNHIAFRRLADDDMFEPLAELNQTPFVTPAQVASGNLDPQDPAGRLKILTWPGYAVLRPFLAYPTPGQHPFLVNPFDGLNRGPFVFSSSRDGSFFTQDDLYSYRIAQANRGN